MIPFVTIPSPPLVPLYGKGARSIMIGSLEMVANGRILQQSGPRLSISTFPRLESNDLVIECLSGLPCPYPSV